VLRWVTKTALELLKCQVGRVLRDLCSSR
jgi:hypothetical protein